MSMESAELQHIAGQEMAVEGKFEWGRVSDEVTELILAHLPVSTLLKARAVNKHWTSMIGTPSFSKFHREIRPDNPWLFVYCTNYLVPSKNQAYAFDPDTDRWFVCPSVSPPSHSPASMAGGVGGIMFATMGGLQSRLCYNHSLFTKKWKQTPEMSFARDAPLVGFLETGSGSDGAAGKLVAVGGVEIEEGDDLAVEIYDTVANQWEVTKSLPEQFRGNSSRHWLSGAVWNRKLYVLEIYSGLVASFDLETKSWSAVRTLRPVMPSGVKYAYLVICSGQLILAGVCYPPELQGGSSFKLWLVDEVTMECKEVGVMPAEFFSMFAKGNGDKNVLGMKCVANGSLIYAYSVAAEAEYPMVVCDVSKGWNAWKKLPALPSKGNRFDAMVGYCSCMPLGSVVSQQ